MADGEMREILVHAGPDEAFNRAVLFARRMAESFSARLHVLYTVAEPLSAGWTAEELVRYTNEEKVDLAIVQLRPGEDDTGPAHALLEHGRCAVLVLR